MSRSSASMRASSSSSAAAALPKLGDSKLLRTKHIDTLEVLETYSRDVDRLTRENQLLTEKLAKLSSLSGDPFAQIQSLQTILQVERDSNQEMASRIKIFGMEADRHRSELSNRDASLRDLSQQFSSLRTEHDALRSTHNACITSRQSLHESIDSLSRRNQELESHSGDVLSLRAQLDKQSSRLQQLEIQAALGPAPSSGAGASDDSKLLKAKLAKSKEKLASAQAELAACKTMMEQEQARTEDQLAANKTLTESVRKLQAELAGLSMQQQQQQPPPVSARQSKQSKEDLARREKEWSAERKELLGQLEAARKSAAVSAAAVAASTAAAAAAAAAPPRPSASDRENRELILHLQSEVSSLRSQLEHVHAQNTHLRAEHTKVSQALNKLLASGGGAGLMGGLSVGGGGKQQAAQASITIASKQGGFAEVMSIKRENEALRAQIQEAQQIIVMLQNKIGQQQLQQSAAPNAAGSAASAASTVASSPPVRCPGSRGSGSGQFGGSKSLQLIAAHEAVHGPVSALSRQSSPPAAASASASGLRGSPQAPGRSATSQAGITVAHQRR